MPTKKTLLFTLILTFSLGQIATDLYLPSLINITHDLSTNTNMVQFTITVYVLSMMISQPIYGIASDGFGRKKTLLLGAIIAVLGTAICCIATDIKILLLGRFIQGLGAGAGIPVNRAIMRDLFTGPDFVKIASTLTVIGMIAMLIAPVLGGYIEHYFNWRMNFFVLLFFGVVTLCSIALFLPETNSYKHRDHVKLNTVVKNFVSLFKSFKFMVYSLAAMLATANAYAWITTGPIMLQYVYGFDPVAFGWIYSLAGIFYITGNLCNRLTVERIGSNRIITLGFTIQLLVGLTLALTHIFNLLDANLFIVCMCVMMFGISVIFPNTNVGALNDFTKIAGTAAALFSVLQSSGAAVSSAYVASSSNHSIMPLALCFSLLSLMGLYFSYLISKMKPITKINPAVLHSLLREDLV